MNIVIANTTLLNGGDAAINEATMFILRRALGEEVSFVCYDAAPAVARRYHPGLAIRSALFDQLSAQMPRWLPRKVAQILVLAICRLARNGGGAALRLLPAEIRRSLAEYRAADLVVSAGGTYLVGHYRLTPRIFDFLVVLALGRPLVLFTQSIGPLPRRGRDRLLLRFSLRRAALIMVRDDRSRRELAGIGVAGEFVVQCPDAVFALAGSGPVARDLRRRNPPRIAVSVRDWPFIQGKRDGGEDAMNRYLDAVAGFVRSAVEVDGAQVTLISTCQGIPEYWTDDSRTASGVLARLSPHVRANVELDGTFRQTEALIERLRQFDLVVATRMHAAILALCAGVPVVPIAYEFKTRELFDALGVGELTSDIETVDAETLYAAWRTAARRSANGHTGGMWRRVALARINALACGRLVAAVAAPVPVAAS